jgi:hypothetical protein
VDNFYCGAGGGCGFDMGGTALENQSRSGALRLRNRCASAGRTGRRDAGGKAAVDESGHDPANDLDRAGADLGDQCRVVVVGCEGVEGDPRPPIRAVIQVRLAALCDPDSAADLDRAVW